MQLALFDLDHTLLAGDSDYLWGRFLAEEGVVDGEAYERENRRHYEAYQAGTLDIHAFLAFALRPLAQLPRERLEALRARFLRERILPLIPEASRRLLAEHRARGHRLLILTATNRFVTAPIAAELGVADLLATEPEEVAGRFTGRVAGIPCFREGKLRRLEAWLAAQGQPLGPVLARAWFYSDSHNDLPLLERVAHPVAVDPDPRLAAVARERGWPVRSLREG
ncbi:MAG: HAD family hydrolase [Gammaproteobacteria bacterium]|nr:MAG: HAD family hydrolase [Gammaproteobacteria bacterium]